jgi:lipopolysaccharide/colanic/teichoic acid biosynthesis glycosyltransferase
VEAYTQYQRLRLSVMPGVTGLWQVAGRSRVAFDDMVFQDVVYSHNATLLTDVSLCLRTVPAMLSGRGAA